VSAALTIASPVGEGTEVLVTIPIDGRRT